MVNYDDIEEGKIIIGVGMSGKEVTGVCTNVMSRFRLATVKYGNDRLDCDTIAYENIIEVKEVE